MREGKGTGFGAYLRALLGLGGLALILLLARSDLLGRAVAAAVPPRWRLLLTFAVGAAAYGALTAFALWGYRRGGPRRRLYGLLALLFGLALVGSLSNVAWAGWRRSRQGALAREAGVDLAAVPAPHVFPAGWAQEVLEPGLTPQEAAQRLPRPTALEGCTDPEGTEWVLYLYFSRDLDRAVTVALGFEDGRLVRVEGFSKPDRYGTLPCTP